MTVTDNIINIVGFQSVCGSNPTINKQLWSGYDGAERLHKEINHLQVDFPITTKLVTDV